MQGKQQKAGKNLALGGNVYVSIRQRADLTVGFSPTNGHVSAGRQPLGEEGTAPSLGQDRSKVCGLQRQQATLDASSMVQTPEILVEINEMIIQAAVGTAVQ